MFFIKPAGTTDEPIRPFTTLDSIHEPLCFSKNPVSVKKDDVLIVYGVGVRQIMGLYNVLSDTYELTEDMRKAGYDERWKYCRDTKLITPKFSQCWWDYEEFTIKKIVSDYNVLYPGKAITASGKDHLKGLQMGADKIALHVSFGQQIVDRIMTIENTL